MKTSKKQLPWLIPFAAVALVWETGCDIQAVQVSSSAIEVEASPRPDAVCNPFGAAGPSAGSDHGLLGSLFVAPAGEESWKHALDYQDHGSRVEASLYVNQLNVPTRPFDQGFVTQDGTVLKTPSGSTLYEWFGLRMDSVLRLTDQEQPGRYQFALLADDGAVLSIDDGNGFRNLIDNDGFHPSKLGCASEGIALDYDSRLPIRVDYFQGPRYHISLMLLWRKVADVNPSYSDSACGKEGNDKFFDSTKVPSAAMPTYLNLLQRGWKVVAAENYLLPAAAGGNPCAGGGSGGSTPGVGGGVVQQN